MIALLLFAAHEDGWGWVVAIAVIGVIGMLWLVGHETERSEGGR